MDCMKDYCVKDIFLVLSGEKKIDWVFCFMLVF